MEDNTNELKNYIRRFHLQPSLKIKIQVGKDNIFLESWPLEDNIHKSRTRSAVYDWCLSLINSYFQIVARTRIYSVSRLSGCLLCAQ